MSKIPDDPSCRVIQRAQHHMRERMGDVITKDDVRMAEHELGEQLVISKKK